MGQDHGPAHGGGHLLGALNTQTNMVLVVPDGNKCLELGPVASAGLFLHRPSLQNLIFEGCSQKKVGDLRLHDRQGEETELFQGLQLHVLYQQACIIDKEPPLVLDLASAPARTTAVTLVEGSSCNSVSVSCLYSPLVTYSQSLFRL